MTGYDKDYIYEIAKDIVEERKISAESKVLQYEQILESDPEYIKACNKRAKIVVEIATKKHNGENVGRLYDDLKDAELEVTKSEEKHNITRDMLVPAYFCKKCNDTGFVGREKCDCIIKIYNEIVVKKANINFEDYTLLEDVNKDFYKSENISKSIDKLIEFIDKYDTTQYNNIVVMGKSGVGKTYIVKCFAKSMVERGKTVYYTSAYNLSDMFMEMTVSGYENKKKILGQLLDVDLLIIDDIGTEQMYKNITIPNLYNLIEERTNRGKKIIFTTNNMGTDFSETYGERINSRIFDKRKSIVMYFNGEDIRRR